MQLVKYYLFLQVKRPMLENAHWPQYTAELKSDWS